MQTIENYQYDKKGFLGAGSFGHVYKAKNIKTGEVVALKILDMKLFTDQFMLDSLKNEIKVMQMLTSPNVVRMIEVFGNKQQTYMAIELCDYDLRKVMNKTGYIQESQCVDLMAQLMNGFKDLVSHNYIHRDIKPENCLVKSNIYKVADFGFATKVDITGKQLLKECVGTPIYMSPQILNKQQYSAKSDIWSIGMMYYEMLFGKTAWACRDMYSLLRAIKTQPLRFPYGRPISQQSKNFIQQCLHIEEKNRISWNELFTHELFTKKQEETQQPKQKELSSQCIRILRTMQDVVAENGIDPHFIFQKFDKDKNNVLDYQEFKQLMLAVDPKTPEIDSQILFSRICQKDQKVDYVEFQKLFTEFDFSDLNDRAGLIINDIKAIIRANNLNITQIFNKYDKNHQGDLDYKEFTNLIRVIVPGIKDFEIQLMFTKFDRDGNGAISFPEFQYILSKGTGQTQKEALNQRSQGILKQLQNTIRMNNLDILKIFQRFDKSGDGVIDQDEFLTLLRAIDGKISKNEAAGIFYLFDKNRDDMISFEEFKQMF